MDSSYISAVGDTAALWTVIGIIFIPLGVWKFIEIIWWACIHVKIGVIFI